MVYTVPHSAGILVHNGDHVDKGQELTAGALNPHDVLRIRGVDDDEFGRMGVRSYITSEVQKVYRQQGVDINDKHIEVIVRQMMRKVRVEDAGRHQSALRRDRRYLRASRPRTSSLTSASPPAKRG